MQNKRKYLSEFAVAMQSSHVVWFPASEISAKKEIFPELQKILDNCHIYLICKMPRISLSEKSFSYKEGKIKGDIVYKIKGKEKSLPFEQDFPLLDGATQVRVSEYPHREIITFNKRNEKIRFMPANLLTIKNKIHNNIPELCNLEILYIGQAYAGGNRATLDRLNNHSTLQKILAEIQYSSPDDEISILTFKYDQYHIISSMDSRAKAEITDYRDIERFYNIMDNPLTEKQQICLIEAGLIRYFQPKYNTIYKDRFPSEKHKILKGCYKLDFSALMIQIHAEELSFILYSQQVEPNYCHFCNIELTDPEKRFGFFHISIEENKTMKMSNVITKLSP